MVKDLTDPTNVDSVPAMLTPGEYVVNKEATQMFGPQIHAMNQAGLAQRKAENTAAMNQGGTVWKMGYNDGGLVGFLKKHEGWRDKAYQDSGGVWTIGYGRTRNADGTAVKKGQTTTRKAEDSWINKRAKEELAAINSFADKHGYDWSAKEKEALASFRYNGGQGMIDQLTADGTRDMATIKSKFGLYNKAGGKKIDGLVNRRNYEMEHAGWGTVGAAPEGSSATTFSFQEQQPEEEAMIDVSPQAEAGDQMIAGLAQQALARRDVPVMHQPSIMSQAPAQPQYIPSVTEKKKVQTFNTGGWLAGLFQQDPRRKEALRRRPGFRNLDPFTSVPKGMVPPGTQGTAPAPTGREGRPTTGVGQQLNSRFDHMTNTPPDRPPAPPSVDPMPPVPGSDEAILQGSSQQVEKSEVEKMRGEYREQQTGFTQDPSEIENWSGSVPQKKAPPKVPGDTSAPTDSGWASLSQEDFLKEAQPKGVDGGSADPTAPSEMQGQPSKRLDKKGETPLGGGITASPDKTAKAKALVTNVNNEEGAFKPEGGTAAVIKAGQQAAQQGSPQRKQVKTMLEESFGDLFNKKELMRMGIVMLGAMATGASPGQALAYAGQMYLNRVDTMNANRSKLNNDLIKGGKYTPESIKAYMESNDPSQLVSVKAPRVGTGEFKTYYSPSGKQVNAEKVKVGDGQYVWVGENGEQITAKWKTDPASVAGTQEYSQRVKSDTGQYVDMLKGLRSANARKLDKYGNTEYATGIVPEVAGRDVARWGIDNDVPPELMGELVQNAYDAAAADSKDGKKVKSLTPYLNDLYVKATVGDASLFQTPSGKAMSADKINGLIGGMTKQAMAAGSFGNSSEAVARKQIITHFQKMWNDLDPGTREQYNRQANKNESGFFVFVRKQSLQ